MHPETGITILKILKKRVPLEATSVVCDDGSTWSVRSLDWVGRDFGDDFDHFSINEMGEADSQFLHTSDIAKIIDPTDGRVIFDAQVSDQRMPREQIRPFNTQQARK